MKAIMTTVAAFVAIAAIGLVRAGEPTCSAEPSCAAPACCDPGCCCPKCGCHEGMIPVCHPYCTTKKVVKYHYCCKCEELCIPGRFPCCPKCAEGCCENGGCTAGCGCTENGARGACGCEEGKCNCLIREVHKLVKIPYTVEVPVRKCTIEWVCPKCGCNCGCTEKADSAPAPAAPMPPSPPAPEKSASARPINPAMAGYYSASDDVLESRVSK
ncbi:MAG TPA: hypothetical protein VGY55_22460 [Pirellulales bacterium]|jgi:hypothetical protein|nr:hypothetical protein [Pirellulales bacterium]